MKGFRAHRFPPLSAAALGALRRGAAPDAGHAGVAERLDQGLQAGLEEGYRDGHSSGLAQGHAEGFSEGRKQGAQQGYEQARQQALAAFENVARPLEALLVKLEHLHVDYQSAQRKEVVDLVARVARQVIRCELTLQPVQLLALVDETLASMPPVSDGGIVVYLNAEDLRRIHEIDPKRFRRWTLLADPRLEAGECRVRAGDHEVDAGCNQRLAACMEQVSAQLHESKEQRALPEIETAGMSA